MTYRELQAIEDGTYCPNCIVPWADCDCDLREDESEDRDEDNMVNLGLEPRG